MTIESRVMTKTETAAYMHLTIAGVEKLIAQGRLRPVRYPGIRRYFFDKRAVDLLVEQSQTSAVPATVPATGSRFGFSDVARGLKR